MCTVRPEAGGAVLGGDEAGGALLGAAGWRSATTRPEAGGAVLGSGTARGGWGGARRWQGRRLEARPSGVGQRGHGRAAQSGRG
uniref:Uncharacterized protein n=1 Tax=Arundo donax TaxID=35708 RepID=A0A0A9H040_ARUDO